MSKAQKKRSAWGPGSELAKQRSRIGRASAENRPVLEAFSEWLEPRGLAPGTITHRVTGAGVFAEAVSARLGVSGSRAIGSLTADTIEDFFVEYGQDHGMAARRTMSAAMRLVLEFAACRGWVNRELVDAVPSLRGYRLSGLPRGLSDEELGSVLGCPWGKGECFRRDRAIVYLLATYGARRGQVSALRLTDLDWRESTIRFAAHKGGKTVEHELTECVAETLAEYLREERPASECEYVFLRARSPHLRLGPNAISMVVSSRMARCGLPPRGPHAFRHAFATRLLRAGQPVKAIADLLGHRSLEAVAIYAKVDYSRLIEVAVEWPEVVS